MGYPLELREGAPVGRLRLRSSCRPKGVRTRSDGFADRAPSRSDGFRNTSRASFADDFAAGDAPEPLVAFPQDFPRRVPQRVPRQAPAPEWVVDGHDPGRAVVGSVAGVGAQEP